MADALYIAQLIEKQLRGNISGEEDQVLRQWAEASPVNHRLLQQWLERGSGPARVNEEDIKVQIEMQESLAERLSDRFGQYLQKRRLRRRRVIRYAIAASVLLAITAIGLHHSYSTPDFSSSRSGDIKVFLTDWRADSAHTIIDLGNGRSFRADEELPGRLAWEHGFLISKLDSQHYSFSEVPGWPTDAETQSSVKHTGRLIFSADKRPLERIITLPDQSKITLSPGSSFYYAFGPTGDTQRRRIAALIGEARFEVTDNHNTPFLLETNKGEVRVLGTTFSVSDYGRENSFELYLIEGKVEVSNGKIHKVVIPLQMVTIDGRTPGISISSPAVLPERHASGFFNFGHKTLIEGMKEIAAHYHLQIVLMKGVDTSTPDKLGGGDLSKNMPVGELLEMLDNADHHFLPKGDTIFVSK